MFSFSERECLTSFCGVNIPEDNQCLRFILFTGMTFGNVEVLRRKSFCWLSLLGNRFCTTHELVVGAKASTSHEYIVYVVFITGILSVVSVNILKFK